MEGEGWTSFRKKYPVFQFYQKIITESNGTPQNESVLVEIIPIVLRQRKVVIGRKQRIQFNQVGPE